MGVLHLQRMRVDEAERAMHAKKKPKGNFDCYTIVTLFSPIFMSTYF